MPDELCRITMLEEGFKQMKADHADFIELQKAHNDKVMEMLADLKEIRTKDVGFIGGIVFTISALWAVFTYILPEPR